MKIKLNHWFIDNNKLSISLMRFYVIISIYKNDNLCFILRVNNGNMEDMYLYFNTLEEAIAFTENQEQQNSNSNKEKIDNSRSFDEILIAYKEHYCGKSK